MNVKGVLSLKHKFQPFKTHSLEHTLSPNWRKSDFHFEMNVQLTDLQYLVIGLNVSTAFKTVIDLKLMVLSSL